MITFCGMCGGCRDATVIQIVSSPRNMSNRFYTVHPRRNDRFIKASALLQTIYREVDFSRVQFYQTHAEMQRLHEVVAERFLTIVRRIASRPGKRGCSCFCREDPGQDTVLLWFPIMRHGPTRHLRSRA